MPWRLVIAAALVLVGCTRVKSETPPRRPPPEPDCEGPPPVECGPWRAPAIGGAPPQGRPAVARRITSRDADGFYAFGWSDIVAQLPSDALVLETPEELCWLAQRLSQARFPAVDFARYVVVVLVLGEADCLGPAEPQALAFGADGVLRPQWVSPYTICPATAGSGRQRAAVLVVARHAVPEEGFSLEAADGVVHFRLRHPLGRLAVPPDDEEPLARPLSGPALGAAALPPPHEARLARLFDGTFVWIVRHGSGEVSVLDPTVDAGYRCMGFPGLRRVARWERLTRRFEGRWDEFGVSSVPPNLGRYEAEIDAASGVIRIGAPASPLRRKRMEPIHDEQSSGSQMNLAIKAFPWISLDDALRAPHGATVLVDASVYVDAHGVVRACRGAASSADAHCSPDEPTLGGLRGATAPPGTRIDGPLVVRVRGGALHDVLLTRD